MNLGIDIGSTKTVIYSTQDHGVIVEDEFGRREIATVLERTRPIRTFGKSVSGDNPNSLKERRRFFLEKILEAENQENVLMFLNYLNRAIVRKGDYRDACMAIPESFGEHEKQVLRSIALGSDLKVGSFLTHLTSIAACAALRTFEIPEAFMIVDCGYTKTSVGAFRFVDHCLTPIHRWTIPIGGRYFDEAVYSILIRTYSLPDSETTREKIYKEINSVKRGLNDLSSVNLRILTEDFQICNMTIHQDEYLAVLKPVFEQLTAFFEKVKEDITAPTKGGSTPATDSAPTKGESTPATDSAPTKGESTPATDSAPTKGGSTPATDSTPTSSATPTKGGSTPAQSKSTQLLQSLSFDYVEVVGNNSHNIYVQKILKKTAFKTTLSSSESAALGACLAQGVNTRKMKFKVEEILGKEIAIKLQGEDVRPTVVYAAATPVTREVTKIKYLRKADFNLEVYEDGVPVALIRVSKKPTDSPEAIAIRVKISAFLTFEVEGLEGGTDASFAYESFSLSEERINEIKEVDDSFRREEVKIQQLAEKRNFLENFLDSFDVALKKIFPELLQDEDAKAIDAVRDAFFNAPPVTQTLDEEEALKKRIFQELAFIGDRLAAIEKSIKNEANEILEEFDARISKQLTFNTAASRALHGHIYSLRGFLATFSCNFETFTGFEPSTYANLKKKITSATEAALKEQAKEEEKAKNVKNEASDQKETTGHEKKEQDKNVREGESETTGPEESNESQCCGNGGDQGPSDECCSKKGGCHKEDSCHKK